MPAKQIAYTVPEAARVMQISERTLQRMVADGRFPYVVRIGRCVRIPLWAPEKWLLEKVGQ